MQASRWKLRPSNPPPTVATSAKPSVQDWFGIPPSVRSALRSTNVAEIGHRCQEESRGKHLGTLIADKSWGAKAVATICLVGE